MDPILNSLDAIQQYGGKYAPGIIGQIFARLDVADITVLTNIKGKTHFSKLSVGKGLKPYTGNFTPEDKLTFTLRTVDPQMFQFDVSIEPKKYRLQYTTEMIGKGATDQAIPYENFTWQKITEEVADEIINALYLGQKGGSNSDKAKNVFDGFKKRLEELATAGYGPIVTGSITSSNAVTKLETFYTEAMAARPQWREKMVNLYCSYNMLDKYTDHYRTLFNGNDPQNWSDSPKDVYLKKNKGKVKITPVIWLGTSDRLILAPKENLVMATDSLSDLTAINIVKGVYKLDAGITGTIDCQIIDEEAVWYNEQV